MAILYNKIHVNVREISTEKLDCVRQPHFPGVYESKLISGIRRNIPCSIKE